MTPLHDASNRIVGRWGEMGGYWGINRTMAEIHALLFVTREPLCTDDIMSKLQISRGNTSMNVRSLLDWGLIERVHKRGDRKEYFKADTDVWHMFETIMRERRRREVEPIINTLEGCLELVSNRPGDQAAEVDDPEDVETFRQRVKDLSAFLTAMGSLFDLVLMHGRDGMQALLAKPAGA